MRGPGRTGAGGPVAIVAVAALGAACLAGSPLYLSSVASGALQDELAQTCLADVGVLIPMTSISTDDGHRLDEAATPLGRHTQPSVLTAFALVSADVGGPGVPPTTVWLLDRPGQEANLGRPLAAPGDGEVLVPEWLGAPHGLHAGDTLSLHTADDNGVEQWRKAVRVANTYPAVPTRPEPAFWCGLRRLFRSPTSDPADPPTPTLLAPLDDIATVGPGFRASEWELRPEPKGLSRHDAAVLADRFDEFVVTARHLVGVQEQSVNKLAGGDALRAVVRHAGTASAVVAGTMAPVRLAGLLAAVALLTAATALVARERERELRLRLLKGQSPGALGAHVAAGTAAPVIIGGIVGSALALLAVRSFGPAPELERAAVRSALQQTVLGVLVAVGVVGVVAAARVGGLVDGRSSTGRRTAVRFVPWELVPMVAAVAAFTRLDRIGGIQQIGARVAHADLGAQAFPLLAIVAPLAVLTRPLLWLLRRWRLAGGRLPPSLLTGLRRSLAEPAVTAAIVLATALAAGSFTLARTLTDSARTMLHDKATTFIGSDEAVTTDAVRALPSPFDAYGTVVLRAQGHSGDRSVDLLGVDPATFSRAVHWRADAADRPLGSLLSALRTAGSTGPTGATPVIVVGGALPEARLTTFDAKTVDVRPVGTAHWFPGFRNGALLVVVDRDALARSPFSRSTEIWLRDPPPDVVTQLTTAGVAARSPVDLTLVFDVTSFRTVRWAYATLSVLAVLVGVVVLLAQLLVLDARRQRRQAAHVLTARMGLGRGGEARGLVAEIAPALVVGAVVGTAIGCLVARLSVARLDSLRQLRPPARLVADPALLLPMVAALIVTVVVLAGAGLVMAARTRPMEVMRGGA